MASSKTRDGFDVLVVGSGASGGWAAKRLAEAVLGHYLMDHLTGGGAWGDFEEAGEKPTLDRPSRPNGIYAIRFRNSKTGPRDKRFLRGYGFQGGGDSGFNWRAAGFGAEYKKALMQPVTTLGLGGFAECLARFENHVEIDPSGQADVFGIPILKVDMTWGDNEKALLVDMAETAAEMLGAAGVKNIETYAEASVPGYGIHEVGVARMGADPKKSALNAFQETHDVKNLFVMDGSGFTSSACQNPTLTIMALTVRSTDYLLGEMKRGNL